METNLIITTHMTENIKHSMYMYITLQKNTKNQTQDINQFDYARKRILLFKKTLPNAEHGGILKINCNKSDLSQAI